MKVIWLKKISDGPPVGSVSEVTEAYARNFLLPKQIAQPANKQSLVAIEQHRTARQQEADAQQAAQRQAQTDLSGQMVTLTAPGNPQGRLFAALKIKDILPVLQSMTKGDIRDIAVTPDHFKTSGTHQVTITWPDHQSVSIELVVNQ